MRMTLFPITTRIEHHRDQDFLTIAGCNLVDLAEQFGTPLYLYDQATLDNSLAEYRQTLEKHYPGEANLTYAGKAFLCIGIGRWVNRHDLWVDCTGAGELYIAKSAGIPRSNLVVHGVNKNPAELASAIDDVGTLVVDNLTELSRLLQFTAGRSDLPNLWLRLRPGLAVDTHAYTQTGQEESKFGLSLEETHQAIRFCLENHLPLTGLHFHLGSHFHDPTPLAPALDILLKLVSEVQAELGWTPRVVCPGGGWGVPYSEADLPHPLIEEYVAFIAKHLVKGCQEQGLPLPRLQLEPGRSLIARAGVALYRVGLIKQTASRRWLLIDGGMADNPRPALYGARYSALPVLNPSRPYLGPTWIGGPYCESGDVLIEALPMPDIQPGELIAIPVSGAYQISMSSNYNGACKPAVLWLKNGTPHLILRREIPEDLTSRDVIEP